MLIWEARGFQHLTVALVWTFANRIEGATEMTRTFKGIVITAIVLIAIAGVATALVLSNGCSAALDSLTEARTSAMNAVIDTAGVKEHIETELYDHAGDIAEQTGIPQSVIDNAIETLDIKDWQVTSLPDTAVESGTFSIDTGDVAANITTYDDPSIATVEAYGQTLTLEVPESAQPYMSLLNYLQ